MLLASPYAAGACRRRVNAVLTVGLLVAAVTLPPREAHAQELRQTDWSAGPGHDTSSNLTGETGFRSTMGQWSFGTASELQATTVLFHSDAAGPTRSLRAIESASSAFDYVGFTGCEVALTLPAPECRALRFFVHRDTTTGITSLVSVADGSGTMGCAGGYEAAFTTSSGVTLAHSDDVGEVTLVGGAGVVVSTWSNGCADGFILELPGSGATVDGSITRRTNLQELEVVANALGGVLIDVPLGSLPNNGAPGTNVPFAFAAGLTGTLESSVFALGAAHVLVGLDLDAETSNATVAVFLRTGASSAELEASAWLGPFAEGDALTSVSPGAFVQYRVDVALADPSTTPAGPGAFARLEELVIALEVACGDDGDPCDDGRYCTAGDACEAGLCVGSASPCVDGLSCTDDVCDETLDACDHVVATGCVIDAACVSAGAINPLDACEVCDPLLPLQWSVATGCSGCDTNLECTTPGLGVCDVTDHACVACSALDASACGGLTPVCDPGSRTCRACADDDECVDPSLPYCSTGGACVACERHLDCPSNAPICASGDCVVCVESAECLDRDPGAALCNDASGTCGACLDASGCLTSPGGSVCIPAADGNRCGCTAEAECGVGSSCDVPRQRCFPLATADRDGDSVPDDKDADDDNDGITDVVEGGGTDYSLDYDQDGTPNWRDPEAPGFVDDNGDGTDDRSDADRDGVPNQLDLDADNDGVPDTLENAGRDVLDADRDGRLDDVLDRDRDGLATTADADDDDPMQTTSVVPLRNTDGDELPDFLDADADAEGGNDTLEAGGADSNEDGRLDGFSDGNMNGLADRVDRMSGGLPLPLPDTDRDGIWDFQDDSDAPRVSIRGGDLCAAGMGGSGGGSLLMLGWLWLLQRRFARRRRHSAC